MSALETYAVVVVVLGAISVTVFPFAYARRDWRASSAGQAIMSLGVALMLLYDLSVVAAIFGPFPGLMWAQAVVYTLCTAATWRLLLTMLHRNRR